MDEIRQRIQQQQEMTGQQRRQRIRELETKCRRCISEISWVFFPNKGFREIDVDAARQTVTELFDAILEIRRLERRQGGGDGYGA